MPISSTEIEFRYTGGASNTNPNASLGGAPSTAGAGKVDDSVLHDLFDQVTSAEAAAGDVEYRCIAIWNANGTLTLQDARIYLSADSSETDDTIDLALAGEAVNTAPETVADEDTAPVGETFTHPTTYAGGLQLNGSTGLPAGQYKGVWVRRTTGVGAAAGTITGNTIKVEGQTA